MKKKSAGMAGLLEKLSFLTTKNGNDLTIALVSIAFLIVFSFSALFVLSARSDSEVPASASSEASSELVSSEADPSSEAVSSVPPQKFVKVINIDEGSTLNIRQAPSADSEILGKGISGDVFSFVEDGSTEGWAKILYNGQEAYVSREYVSVFEQ